MAEQPHARAGVVAVSLTHAGRVLNPTSPAVGDIEILDIAHHLATINRFCGAAARPYSMAEHCLLLVEILERDARYPMLDPCALLAGLLWHAHAAYLGDPGTPAMLQGGNDIETTQARVQAAIWRRFDLRTAAAGYAVLLHRADLAARATAARDLLRAPASPEAASWIDLRQRDGMQWRDWRAAYVERFGELAFARNLYVRAS